MEHVENREKIKELRELYMEKGRHSQYQLLASDLQDIVGACVPYQPKYERERLDYIEKNLDLKDKALIDIGGNTGYFTFEACKLGAKSVDYYEGNKTHADFVRLASEVLGTEERVTVYNEYYLAKAKERRYDVAVFLNVLHHLGYDYCQGPDIERAKGGMIEYLNQLSCICDYVVLQMGFNWGGDIKKCLFLHGTKQEMEDYIKEGTKDFWEIEKTGIPVQRDGKIVYEDVCPENNRRDDAMGEFLNRPLFIMRSKTASKNKRQGEGCI